ncbi:hypothetical protein HDF24_19385 [Mucilaginibacter sp. X4EP1]|uniref:hypothetical protein n=1 Tax=Mucilaginibacter sp. X4EP1 TaxID=2723092 RepID=UPI002169BD3F|nr:hypothetical protein [Mucilaginibacter sp. X4EP1]MCS3812874.1 chromate transport protein ChrA [Mucilaginibacter sp. X4EP1]
MNKRFLYAIILALIVLFTAYEELHFRKYLFSMPKTVIIAGSLPNFLAAMLFAFAYMVIKNPVNNAEIIRSITFIVIGLILYEFAQIWIPNMVFDVKDIIASILGGALSYLIIYWVNYK